MIFHICPLSNNLKIPLVVFLIQNPLWFLSLLLRILLLHSTSVSSFSSVSQTVTPIPVFNSSPFVVSVPHDSVIAVGSHSGPDTTSPILSSSSDGQISHFPEPSSIPDIPALSLPFEFVLSTSSSPTHHMITRSKNGITKPRVPFTLFTSK